MLELSRFSGKRIASPRHWLRSHRLSKGDGELYQLPYAEVICPGNAFEVYGSFHKGCSCRRIVSELAYAAGRKRHAVESLAFIFWSASGPSSGRRMTQLSVLP